MHRQQRSQRTKVEHRPWNDASFYFYKDTNDLGSLFWEEGGGERFPRATLLCLCRTGHRRRTHTERPILSGVYTTQCTSHYSPLSHNDRYLLASHSRPIPLIWTDSAMPTNDLYQLRLLQSTLCHWSTDCYRDSDYNSVVIHQIRVLTHFIRSDSTQQDAIRQFPLAYSFEVLCSVSFFAQKL